MSREQSGDKDAQKCMIRAFKNVNLIYEFGMVEYVFKILNQQLETWMIYL